MHIYEAKYATDTRNIYTDVFFSIDDKLFYVSQCTTDQDGNIVSVANTELTLGQVAKISEAAGRAYLANFLDDYKLE